MTQMMEQTHKVSTPFVYQGLEVPQGEVYRVIDKDDRRVHMERVTVDSTDKGIAQSMYISIQLFENNFEEQE